MDLIKKANTSLPYTIIYNQVAQSRRITMESKGLLFMLLSLPEPWVVNKKWILKTFPIKRRALDKCFKELEEEGYICSFEQARAKGKYKQKGYLIYPSSQTKDYDYLAALNSTDVQNEHRYKRENTDVHLPTTVNVHLYNKEKRKHCRVNSLNGKRAREVSQEDGPF